MSIRERLAGTKCPRDDSSQVLNENGTGGVDFLAHQQLHEVLFTFFEPEVALDYRCIHSACDALVAHYARTRLQDVVGQDLDTASGEQAKAVPRTIDVCFLKLLVSRGENIEAVLANSEGGVRTISPKLFSGEPPASINSAVNLLCSVMTKELARGLRHVHLQEGSPFDCAVADIIHRVFMHLVGTSSFGLRSLNTTTTNISDSDITDLVHNCHQLQSINIENSDGKITDTTMKVLVTNCSQLRSLNISWTDGKITDEVLELLANNCRELRCLCFSKDSYLLGTQSAITDTSMKLVAVNCRQLQSLDVSETRGSITDETVKLVATNCSLMQSLNVSGTRKITDTSIKLLAMNCFDLRSLDVSATEGITDESIQLVATNCRHLRVLNIAWCWGTITDKSIKLVATNCSELVSLDVSNTAGNITDKSITLIAASCPMLQSLSVSRTCGAITDASMKLVATHCLQLQSLDVSETYGSILQVLEPLLTNFFPGSKK